MKELNVTDRTWLARRREGKALHIVQGVTYYPGVVAPISECGVRNLDVIENKPTRGDRMICKRCAKVVFP